MSRKRKQPGATGSRVTMHQIARAAHVSLGTVSHVMNATAPVREPLKQRVLDAIAALGYSPNQLSRGLRLNRTSLIGMVIPDITNPFFPAVVRGVEDTAFKASYRLMLCNADNDSEKEAAYLNDLRSFLPAGILLIPSLASTISTRGSTPPVVCIDRIPEGWTGDSVTVDNFNGGRAAARHLLEMGHRQIGIVSGPTLLTNAGDRVNGFLQAMREADVPLAPEYIQETFFEHNRGYAAAMTMLTFQPRPTAIFATSDLIAMGVLCAIRDSQLRCPEDVSLLSFDGLYLSEVTFPTLTSVFQPGYELGCVAARLLLDRIEGLDTAPQNIVLDTELKPRHSVLRLTPTS